MANRVFNNKKYGTVSVLFTSNDSITVAGNSSVSNVAIGDEILTGASITKIWFGSPSGNAAHWVIKRGSNAVFVVDGSQMIDFSGEGSSITLDTDATLVANLVGSGTGTLIVQLRKIPAANGFPNL